MKKVLSVLVAVSLLAIGCQTGGDINATLNDKGVVLKVSLAQTRIALGDKVGDSYPAYWSEGDRLVANGVLSDEAIIEVGNRSNAMFQFSGTTSLGYPLHIAYPYSAATTAERTVVEFPAEQRYTPGSFEVGSAPMCGYVASKENKIVLNHLAAVLRFPIKAMIDNVVLDRVVVTATSGAKLSGEFVVDCHSATLAATENTSNVVTYNLPRNFVLSKMTDSIFYISLPAVDVGSCTIEFVEASGEKMVANWAPKGALSRGVVREFSTITYQSKANLSLSSYDSEMDELLFDYKMYADDTEIKIMSFNVRTETSESDPANNWENRKAACVALIKDHRPTVIGFQEAKYTSQWLYLKEQLASRYDGYGVNRDNGAESGTGEVMGILYNKNIVEKIDGGTFWLSETPDKPSKGFGANYSRNATWGLFKHIPSGKTFYYINTHLDHQVAEAQIEGMKLISQYFERYKDTYPIFLTGDLNIKADNEALDVIEGYMNNARSVAALTDFNTTFNNYKTTKYSIIDHIYCRNDLEVVEYHTINEKYCNVEYVSDHYPIYAIVKLK